MKAVFEKILLGIRLLFSKDRELYSFFYDLLGFCPRNLSLYKRACLHRSCARRDSSGKLVSNERLEFLGDAVLNSIVGDMLFHRYRHGQEGFLTKARSKIVRRETLNMLAARIGLTEHVHHSSRIMSHNCFLGGNALEALVGAVYLDRGYIVCQRYVVERLIDSHIDVREILKTERNFKSELIEWGQKHKVDFEFRLEDITYDDYQNSVFHSVVLIGGVEAGRGIGFTKKASHQAAAKEACRDLKRFLPTPQNGPGNSENGVNKRE